MTQALFRPQLTREQAIRLASIYADDDEERALDAGRKIRAGDYARVHLQTVFQWKTKNRGKTRLSQNSDSEILDALRLAVAANESRSTIAVLMGLYGVNTPVASAIATAIYPERFTIFDFRALEALGTTETDRSIPFYLDYLRFCTGLAKDWSISLRTLDRALWQWSADRMQLGNWEPPEVKARAQDDA